MERVVKLIEKSLSPHSRVEHDVRLPDLNSNVGSTRQCDVVIRSGEPPRETITIVEVQDRNKKVDITMFDGWCQKMTDVGAQHLICVSTTGFPKSIKDKALKKGPTVRLVTLSELKKEQWPINLVENYLEYVSVATGKTKFDKIVMFRLEQGQLLRMDYGKKEAPHFQYGGQNLRLSVHDLVSIYAIENDLEEGNHLIEFVLPKHGQVLYFLEGNHKTRIYNLGLSARIEIERGKIPLNFLSYVQSSDTQIDGEQPIAWIMNAVGVFKGEEIDIRATFLPDKKGILRLAHISDINTGKLFWRFIRE